MIVKKTKCQYTLSHCYGPKIPLIFQEIWFECSLDICFIFSLFLRQHFFQFLSDTNISGLPRNYIWHHTSASSRLIFIHNLDEPGIKTLDKPIV